MEWLEIIFWSLISLLCTVVLTLTLLVFLLTDPRKKKLAVKEKVVLITGGTQGLGLSIANECITRGAKVALISRRPIDVTSKDSGVKAHKAGDIISLSADVAKLGEMQLAINEIHENFGKINFVFTVAGLSRMALLENLDDDLMKQQIDVNLVGTLNALKLVIPDLKSQKEGRVCIVSSLAGQVSMWGMSTYSSTKFALKGLTEAIQMEFIDSNIAATIVYPPDMTTPGFEEENKTKPEIVRKISELADEIHPDSIAAGLVNAVENGEVDFTVGIDGWFVARCDVGFGPASSKFNLLSELVLSNLLRIVALVNRKIILRIVRNSNKIE